MGKQRNVLIPATIDPVDPPLGFRLIQAADLTDWRAGRPHAGFSGLIDVIFEKAGSPAMGSKSQTGATARLQDGQALSPMPDKAEAEDIKPVKPKKLKNQPKSRKRLPAYVLLAFAVIAVGIWYYSGRVSRRDDGDWVGRADQLVEKWEQQVRKAESISDLGQYVQLVQATREKYLGLWEDLKHEAVSRNIDAAPWQARIQTIAEHWQEVIENRQNELNQAEDVPESAEPTPQAARLFVEAIPPDAVIAILNISPRFFQGMELKPGRYHAQVSAAGYETRKVWVSVEAGQDQRIEVRLKSVAAD